MIGDDPLSKSVKSLTNKACSPTAALVSQAHSLGAAFKTLCGAPPPHPRLTHNKYVSSDHQISPPSPPPPAPPSPPHHHHHLHQVLQHCLMIPPRPGKGDQLLHAPVTRQQRTRRAGVQGLERGPAGQEDAQGSLLRLREGRRVA